MFVVVRNCPLVGYGNFLFICCSLWAVSSPMCSYPGTAESVIDVLHWCSLPFDCVFMVDRQLILERTRERQIDRSERERNKMMSRLDRSPAIASLLEAAKNSDKSERG